MLRSAAQAAVVHLEPVREELALRRGSDGFYRAMLRANPGMEELARRRSEALARSLEQELGPPDYRDAWVAAWDLERVRAGR